MRDKSDQDSMITPSLRLLFSLLLGIITFEDDKKKWNSTFTV